MQGRSVEYVLRCGGGLLEYSRSWLPEVLEPSDRGALNQQGAPLPLGYRQER